MIATIICCIIFAVVAIAVFGIAMRMAFFGESVWVNPDSIKIIGASGLQTIMIFTNDNYILVAEDVNNVLNKIRDFKRTHYA